MRLKITKYDALIVVDMQKDFMPGGALAVQDADTIIPVINIYIELFQKAKSPIFFTRDWHPKDHLSFQEHGGIWPVHCVQESKGAEFAEGLKLPTENYFIISKGISKEFDAYSGFQGTILNDLLHERGIKRLFICGVATDFCVKNTALGALHLGFFTIILEDGIKEVFESTQTLQILQDEGSILCKKADLK